METVKWMYRAKVLFQLAHVCRDKGRVDMAKEFAEVGAEFFQGGIKKR